MSRDARLWTTLMILGALALLVRAAWTDQGMGREYVRASPAADGRITRYEPATFGDYQRSVAADPDQATVRVSVPRSVGLWLAAFFTLAVFSFLYKDNPFYKIAEAVLVGVSAAYWMVVGFWDVLVPNLFAKIFPGVVQGWAMPGLTGPEAERNLWYLVPLGLGVMLLWRLAPRGAWIARWPLAFIIGTTAGLRLAAFLHGDFLAQIRNTILPLVVLGADGTFNPGASVANILIVGSVLCCLAYFFFSFEHKGVVGGAARVGIWVLMITFGAGFGYTVMGRIALLAIRLEFLLDDWLWLIDPAGRRMATLAQGLLVNI
jgi:hypothetical protein